MSILTACDLARRFVGLKEMPGDKHDNFIQWCHESCGLSAETSDETAWCSTFLNRIFWIMQFPRSKSAAARSWLTVGTPVELGEAVSGNDVVVFWRGTKDGWQGHVGLYVGHDDTYIQVLGGNQSNQVSVANYPRNRLLGVRRCGPVDAPRV